MSSCEPDRQELPLVLPRSVLICGECIYYAILQDTDTGAEVIFRREGQSALYGDFLALQRDLSKSGYILDALDEAEVIDLDVAVAVVRPCVVHDLDAVIVAWNVLEEICAGVGHPMDFRGKLATTAYSKLFWGMNLPSVTPPGRRFNPVWTRKETSKIARVLRSGRCRVMHAAELAGVLRDSRIGG